MILFFFLHSLIMLWREVLWWWSTCGFSSLRFDLFRPSFVFILVKFFLSLIFFSISPAIYEIQALSEWRVTVIVDYRTSCFCGEQQSHFFIISSHNRKTLNKSAGGRKTFFTSLISRENSFMFTPRKTFSSCHSIKAVNEVS